LNLHEGLQRAEEVLLDRLAHIKLAYEEVKAQDAQALARDRALVESDREAARTLRQDLHVTNAALQDALAATQQAGAHLTLAGRFAAQPSEDARLEAAMRKLDEARDTWNKVADGMLSISQQQAVAASEAWARAGLDGDCPFAPGAGPQDVLRALMTAALPQLEARASRLRADAQALAERAAMVDAVDAKVHAALYGEGTGVLAALRAALPPSFKVPPLPPPGEGDAANLFRGAIEEGVRDGPRLAGLLLFQAAQALTAVHRAHRHSSIAAEALLNKHIAAAWPTDAAGFYGESFADLEAVYDAQPPDVQAFCSSWMTRTMQRSAQVARQTSMVALQGVLKERRPIVEGPAAQAAWLEPIQELCALMREFMAKFGPPAAVPGRAAPPRTPAASPASSESSESSSGSSDSSDSSDSSESESTEAVGPKPERPAAAGAAQPTEGSLGEEVDYDGDD
jgi:hypothetical protein